MSTISTLLIYWNKVLQRVIQQNPIDPKIADSIISRSLRHSSFLCLSIGVLFFLPMLGSSIPCVGYAVTNTANEWRYDNLDGWSFVNDSNTATANPHGYIEVYMRTEGINGGGEGYFQKDFASSGTTSMYIVYDVDIRDCPSGTCVGVDKPEWLTELSQKTKIYFDYWNGSTWINFAQVAPTNFEHNTFFGTVNATDVQKVRFRFKVSDPVATHHYEIYAYTYKLEHVCQACADYSTGNTVPHWQANNLDGWSFGNLSNTTTTNPYGYTEVYIRADGINGGGEGFFEKDFVNSGALSMHLVYDVDIRDCPGGSCTGVDKPEWLTELSEKVKIYFDYWNGSTWVNFAQVAPTNFEHNTFFGTVNATDAQKVRFRFKVSDPVATHRYEFYTYNYHLGYTCTVNSLQLYLPLAISNWSLQSFPLHISNAIPTRPVVQQGEIFYTKTLQIPTQLPSGGQFYLSAQPDSLTEVLVDDEVVFLSNGVEVFSYNFSKNGSPQSAMIKIPRTTIEQLAGKTITIQYRDHYGVDVEATQMWLIWVP